MKTNLAVFFGCRSVEHEVSIISAVQAMHAVDRTKYDVIPIYVTKSGEMVSGDILFKIENYRDLPALLKQAKPIVLTRENGIVTMKYQNNGIFSKKKPVRIDIAFPVVHGTNCEDGTIAGYLEYLGLPYIGCDVLSAAVGMDKTVFKDVLKNANLPVLPCIAFRARKYALDKKTILSSAMEQFGFPVIVKPANLGSSVGITKAQNEIELETAVSLAASFADKILIEPAISSLREINCSVLGDADDCKASVLEEPFMHDEILSYQDKYLSGQKGGSKGMASLGRQIPARLAEEKTAEIQDLSCKIFKAIGASGVARIDFLLDTETDTVYANEINTIPGSLAFYLWEASGVKYPELIDRLVEIAFKRQRNRDHLTFTIETNILSGACLGSKGAKGSKF